MLNGKEQRFITLFQVFISTRLLMLIKNVCNKQRKLQSSVKIIIYNKRQTISRTQGIIIYLYKGILHINIASVVNCLGRSEFRSVAKIATGQFQLYNFNAAMSIIESIIRHAGASNRQRALHLEFVTSHQCVVWTDRVDDSNNMPDIVNGVKSA